jgi:hypothetical protein
MRLDDVMWCDLGAIVPGLKLDQSAIRIDSFRVIALIIWIEAKGYFAFHGAVFMRLRHMPKET